MNDDEKTKVRERLGLRYFEILIAGLCPYCGRELVDASDAGVVKLAQSIAPEMLAGCMACVPCQSIWNKPEFGDASDDDNAVERMRRTWRSSSKKGR